MRKEMYKMKDLVKETVKQLPKEVYDDLAHPGLSVSFDRKCL